jgi:hypothetical protein
MTTGQGRRGSDGSDLDACLGGLALPLLNRLRRVRCFSEANSSMAKMAPKMIGEVAGRSNPC